MSKRAAGEVEEGEGREVGGVSDGADEADGERARRLRQKQGSGQGTGSKRGAGGGKNGLPMLQYREGEPLVGLEDYVEDGQLVEVRVPIESLSCSNRQVHTRQLWGSGPYMGDSDLVAAILHSGCASAPATSGNSSTLHSNNGGLASTSVLQISELIAVIQPLPPQARYQSRTGHGIRSRAWGPPFTPREGSADRVNSDDRSRELAAKFSFQVVKCYAIVSRRPSAGEQGGTELVTRRVLLPRAPEELPSVGTFFATNQERIVHTRSRANERDTGHANGSDKRLRSGQEVTVQCVLLCRSRESFLQMLASRSCVTCSHLRNHSTKIILVQVQLTERAVAEVLYRCHRRSRLEAPSVAIEPASAGSSIPRD